MHERLAWLRFVSARLWNCGLWGIRQRFTSTASAARQPASATASATATPPMSSRSLNKLLRQRVLLALSNHQIAIGPEGTACLLLLDQEITAPVVSSTSHWWFIEFTILRMQLSNIISLEEVYRKLYHYTIFPDDLVKLIASYY